MGEHRQRHDPGAWDRESADRYVERWGDHPTHRMTVDRASPAPGEVVVDIGCGSGEAVREVARRLVAGRVLGIDPTPGMLEHARRLSAGAPGLERLAYLLGAAADLSLAAGTVSLGLAINALHHWEAPESGLAEVRRVLRPGGRFLVADEVHDEMDHRGPLGSAPGIAAALRAAGFAGVEASEHVEGDVRMHLVVAWRR